MGQYAFTKCLCKKHTDPFLIAPLQNKISLTSTRSYDLFSTSLISLFELGATVDSSCINSCGHTNVRKHLLLAIAKPQRWESPYYCNFCKGVLVSPQGVLSIFYTGGPCQQFISEPQILSHNFEGPKILSF